VIHKQEVAYANYTAHGLVSFHHGTTHARARAHTHTHTGTVGLSLELEISDLLV